MRDMEMAISMGDSNYIKLQEEGSDWSYNSSWGNQMAKALEGWFHPGKDLNDSVLDVGCGEGRGVRTLLDLGHKNVSGIDLTQAKVDKGASEGLNLICGDVHTNILGHKSVDYIFTSHTLEHMYDLPLVLKNLIDATRKQIWFIIPIRETKDFVARHNPSHVWPINDPKEFTGILDSLGVEYSDLWETHRLCSELFGVIHCDKQN